MKNLHLIISVFVVVPVALVYGFSPNLLFNIHPNTIDEHNVLKAVMGIYLAFASLWILGIFNTNYWRIATISNAIFMLGLASGRLISLFFDGIPSVIFCLGTLGEIILGIYAVIILQKQKTII